MSCFGVPSSFAIGAINGFAVDYFSKRLDGGGTRWGQHRTYRHSDDFHLERRVLSDAGVWVDAASSKDAKTDFAPVDAIQVLEQIVTLPITTWRYREGEGSVRHIGPMAEDFHAAFGVGYGPHTIADLDARGVALAAIQGLNAKVEERLAAKDAEIAALRAELAELRSLKEEVASIRAAQSAR